MSEYAKAMSEYAKGGVIPRQSGKRDDVPYFEYSHGDYVITAQTIRSNRELQCKLATRRLDYLFDVRD